MTGNCPGAHCMAGYSAVRRLLQEAEPGLELEPGWETLRREGLLCLLAEQRVRERQPLPDSIRHTFLQAVAFEMRCGITLAEISEAAQQRGIATLTFKGCALAFGLYPRAGQRSFGDIDLAVRPQHWTPMVDLLKELGFSQGGAECTFVRAELILDLHRHPLHQLTQLIGPRCQEWWEQTQLLSARTGSTLRLAHEHEFVLALFHSAKHSFSRAGWLVDLALLASQVDARRLAEAVGRYRAGRQLAYAAECLDRFFAITFPEPLAELGSRRWNLLERRFMQLVLGRQAPDFLGMLTPLGSAPNPWRALRYLLQTLYPADIPRWQRSKQLLGMARAVLKA